MNSSSLTVSSQSIQSAVAQLYREGVAKEEIFAVLPDVLPPDLCQALELQFALLSECPAQINQTFLFNLLFDCFTKGLEAPDILQGCEKFCTRSDYAFCEVALDYIETHYQPSAYELKAFKNQLYQEYLSATPSAELARRAESIKNLYYKHLCYRTAEIIWKKEQIGQEESAIAPENCQLDVAKSLIEQPDVNQLGESLVELLKTFDINCSLVGISSGSTFNRFKLKMGVGSRVKKLAGIGEDLMASLNLDWVPIITAQSGYVAVDVPRPDRQIVAFTDYVKPDLKSPTDPLFIAGGIDADGNFIEIELSDENVRHIIGGGITGSGKSQWEKAAVASLILRYPPSVVNIALSDVKRVTFKSFKKSPWLYSPVAFTAGDTLKMLFFLTKEMEYRYDEFERVESDGIQVENIQEYNAALPDGSMTRIVCFIDEIFELLSDETYKEEIEKCLMRLLAKAGAAGIHMILFTQRPAANVINPLIRSNCPVKVALRVGRPEDSGIVLGDANDRSAVSLLGYGDLIIKGVEGNNRVQGLYISNEDLQAVLKQAEIELNDPYTAWHTKDSINEKQPNYERREKNEKVVNTQKLEPKQSFNAYPIADPMAEEIEEWVEEKVWNLVDMGVPQNRVIMHVWGVSKGDAGYKLAREKFHLITGESE